MATSSLNSSLIGILDERIDHSTSHTSWDINKIGGKPDWMSSRTSHPQCDACKCPLILVTQLYCPLEDSLYHRTIYVFTCVTDQCQHHTYSFRVFRAQKQDQTSSPCTGPQRDTPVEQPVNDPLTFDTDWCDDADDWGEEGETDDHDNGFDEWSQLGSAKEQSSAAAAVSGSETPFSGKDTGSTSQSDAGTLEQGLEQLSLHSTNPPSLMPDKDTPRQVFTAWSEESLEPVTRSEVVPELVSYYISVFDESSAMDKDSLSHEHQLMKEYQEREGVSLAEWQAEALGMSVSGGDSAGGEGYEKVTAKHGDRTFQKFIKKIQPCPQQCIRYSFSGKPLWMTDSPQLSTSIPACSYCGSQRHFEFQLMPALLPVLQLPDLSVPPIDFGVVVVYTCSQSCWSEDCSDLLLEEVLVVQHDPDSKAIEQRLAHIQQNQR